MRRLTLLLAIAATALVSAWTILSTASAHDHGNPPATQPATQPAAALPGDPYTLDTCPVTGKKIDPKADPIIVRQEGREVRVCSKKCIDQFAVRSDKYLAEIDKKMIEQQVPFYPLAVCPVSGEKIGTMGAPADLIYNNRLVRFCCSGCIKDFKKDPATHIAAINQAVIKAQKEKYPLTTCLVSGDKLDDGAVDYVVANRLIRFCCDECIVSFEKNPQKYLPKLDTAAKNAK